MDEQKLARGELDDLLGVEAGLTAWELDFLDSLDQQRGGTWTARQIGKVHRIWDRLCGAHAGRR